MAYLLRHSGQYWRRVAQRVDELEMAIAQRRERLVAPAQGSAPEPPTLADVAPLLDRRRSSSPVSTRLKGELRAMFDALQQLDVVYRPAESAVDVAVTLYVGGGDTATGRRRCARTTGWSVGRRTWPPRVRTSIRWSRGGRSAFPPVTPRSAVRATANEVFK